MAIRRAITKRQRAKRRGFTLVELMVAMALGMILIGVIAFVFIQSGRIYSETLDEIDATYIVRSSMELIGRDLRAVQLPMFPAEPPATQDTSLDLTIEPNVNATTGAAEDLALVESIQRSIGSGANEFFTFGHFESAIIHFHRNLHAALEKLDQRA